ncbi:MAG: hypothetical protein M1294_12705 [Firmicutes bacterium]|jgi:hypothetical protein|uniref:Uncharacterized protein n=1 Tax=Sulfobacillus benefaciens TaxID=453960 RepID=A0A2T2X9Z6_9FIRM|nr:hypothetical protein [Bacillota bacterium]MCL5015368.1 hypothetical protein [Bacillota bacterium]PSR31312.1 MAG: hypothetical protein C7B43_02790 [Sulfobacillus benefaciens]HBQ95143.1 hypothetical protein [Sulfobacillus sp.]
MKFGNWMSVLGLVAGIWVIVSPYLVGFAPTHGNPWTGIVLGTDILGILIILASIIGLIGYWGLRLKELVQERKS